MQRWHSGLAIAADRSVLITPIESDRLFCFDLLTGSPVFRDKPRDQLRYLAGVRGDKFLLVGQQELKAYDLQSGDLRWQTPPGFLAAGQQIAGRGVFGEDDFFVPTTANQLLQVSLQDGAVLSRRTTRYPLGNLVAAGGEIISQSPTRLSVAFGEASLEPLVNEILGKRPNDFYALVRKAELLIERQQLRDALERLNRAGKIDPDSDEVHMLSVAAMLGILRENPSGEQEIVEQLDAMIDQPNQRAEFLGLLVRGALANHRFDDAAGRLLELSQLLSEESSLDFAADDIINDITRECTLDSWLAARMKDVVAGADQEQLARISQRVSEFIAGNSQAVDSLLNRVVRHFDSLDASLARDELGRRYLDRGESLKLERLALGTSTAQSAELPELSDDRLLMLAKAFALSGRGEDVLEVIDILENRETFSEQAKLEELRDVAIGKIQQFEWNDPVGLKWQANKSVNRGVVQVEKRLSRTLVTWGASLRGWQLVSQGANTVALRDPLGQDHQISLDGLTRRGDDSDKEAIISGGIMIIVRPGEIDAIDLNRVKDNQLVDSLLWKRTFSGDGSASARRSNEMNSFAAPIYWYRMNAPTARTPTAEFRVGPILGDRVMVLHAGDLLAIDLATSETLWRNSSAPLSGTIVADGDRVAVVSAETKVVKFYDKLDGRSLDSQPWEHGKIWHSMGKHVLSELPSEDLRRAEIKIVNPFSGDVLQQLETSTASRAIADGERTFGQIVDSRFLMLLDNNGKLRIWDIEKGSVLSDLETTPYKDLQRLHAMAVDGQLIVIPERSTPTLPDAVTLQTRDMNAGHRTAHALHAVSVDDGSIRWSVEFDELPWGCTVSQPTATPVILLTRSLSTFSTTNSRTVKLDIQAIDVDSGEVLHQRLGKELSVKTQEIDTRMTIQPAAQRLIAQVSGDVLTYFFGMTDDEVAGDR
jgi:tetratricopeptide (TPR) repeat protein